MSLRANPMYGSSAAISGCKYGYHIEIASSSPRYTSHSASPSQWQKDLLFSITLLMKKILAFITIGFWGMNIFWGMTVFAENIKVTVTEQIPGLTCEEDEEYMVKCWWSKSGNWQYNSTRWPECRRYICEIQPWFDSVMLMLSGFIKYATFIVALLGVLMLVYSGIEMSMAGAGGKKDDAKKRIEKVIMGLVLLFMIGFILNSVAPWIYQ